jgi:hypothetical protein
MSHSVFFSKGPVRVASPRLVHFLDRYSIDLEEWF